MADPLFPGATDLEGRAIRQIAALAMDAPAHAKSGHSGTAMALAPLGVMLFSRLLRHDPTDPQWLDRDRFILSLGHASILQYGLAHTFGYDLSVEDLRAFRQLHSRTPGHPERGVAPTVEVTTGPLGQGLANGVGMAIAERVLRAEYGDDLVDHRVWVIAGDGCLEEGISHEAASLAGSLGLGRLIVVYDDNHITIDGPTELALRDDAPARFRAYGWRVIDVGEHAHDLDVLEAAAREACEDVGRPTLIVVRSHIGFPSPTMMDRREAHGSPFSVDAISEAKAILGVEDRPFALDPELPAQMLSSLGAGRDARTRWEASMVAAGERGERLRTQFATAGALSLAGGVEEFTGGPVATRKALQRAMDQLAPHVSGLTAGSADLTDNTGVLLRQGGPQGRDNPGGRQIHYGIREFAMGAILVGQALHGGIRPVGSTFLVFADYARPAVRLAALSDASVLFVFTHDSVGVGEDGPTHQPVEHLMSLRAIPGLHVVRPSDANETLALVEGFFRDPHPAPTALALSRQDLALLEGEAAAASRAGAARGGYAVRERPDADLSLLATGSEVALSLAAAERLEEAGLHVRVVALPCWECFAHQPAEYREAVLGTVPRVAVEAGVTLGWSRYADYAIGIDSFGVSAPGPEVFAHFGFTPEGVSERVRAWWEAR